MFGGFSVWFLTRAFILCVEWCRWCPDTAYKKLILCSRRRISTKTLDCHMKLNGFVLIVSLIFCGGFLSSQGIQVAIPQVSFQLRFHFSFGHPVQCTECDSRTPLNSPLPDVSTPVDEMPARNAKKFNFQKEAKLTKGSVDLGGAEK